MHLVQIATRDAFSDARAREALQELRDWGVTGARGIEYISCYLFSDEVDREAVGRIARRLLADPVTEEAHIDADPPGHADHTLLVMRKAGVMDPVALSLVKAVEHLGLPRPSVRTGRLYRFTGDVEPETLTAAGKDVFANETIEEVHLDAPFPHTFPHPPGYEFRRVEVPLEGLLDEELDALSYQHRLFLDTVEMRTVRDYFAELGRHPTDAELETVAQTWSEHCKHKTFTGVVHFEGERIDNLLKATVMRATKEIDREDCLSVFSDNAGVIRLDETRAVCMKVETHNHPSAIEPYGGAGTGIGGVIRDIMGTGLGARPILNTDVFCFGPPDLPPGELPGGCLHPRRIMKGVVQGVRDYGNRMGIPTANGAVFFDPRYTGNPLVYCGTVGVMPADKVRKAPRVGDLILLAGGRTGRDGIHGVNFASGELHQESEMLDAGAVQIGNPIEEKKLLDAQLRARDEGLYTSVTDCGGGGLSSAVGEMGEELGVVVDLEKVPLKYQGLQPWEIWISEAQERMIFAVPPEHRERALEVFEEEDSEAVIIGAFTGEERLVLRYEGETVADLPMAFLHDGLPRQERIAVWDTPEPAEPPRAAKADYGDDLKAILSAGNVCSKEWVIRQYDHEVQGLTVVKPLVGPRFDGPGDGVVFTAEPGERRGMVVAAGMNPHYGDLDPYAMAAAAVDEAVRNNLAVGGSLATLALLDNFSWGNTDRPRHLGALVLASRALYDVAVAYHTPFISGKDSLHNEFGKGDDAISIPHTLLVSSLSVIEDIGRAVTMDLKEDGHALYLLGRTLDEMGGSHYLLLRDEQGATVPQVDTESALRTFRAVETAIDRGLLRACHDLSEGGLAVAAAEMGFAGGLGAEIDLLAVPRADGLDRSDVLLFSESQSRFLAEVSEEDAPAFEALLSEAGAVGARIGRTAGSGRLVVRAVEGTTLIDEALDDLREAHQAPLRW